MSKPIRGSGIMATIALMTADIPIIEAKMTDGKQLSSFIYG
jgi:hypothetical protein